MKTFGQVIVAARKAAGLTQKAVVEGLRRADGRNVLPPYLNDLEHSRRYPPENEVIEQLAKILKISADALHFYARRLPGDVMSDFDECNIEASIARFEIPLTKAAPLAELTRKQGDTREAYSSESGKYNVEEPRAVYSGAPYDARAAWQGAGSASAQRRW